MQERHYLTGNPISEEPHGLNVEDRGRYIAIVPSWKNLLMDRAHPFYKELAKHPMPENRGRAHCVDLEKVDHVSSETLLDFTNLHNRLMATAVGTEHEGKVTGKLGLIVNPQVYEVFVITRLHTFFNAHTTRKDYEDSLR